MYGHLEAVHPEVKLGFDLADLTGYAYYSGVRFGVYAAGSPDAILARRPLRRSRRGIRPAASRRGLQSGSQGHRVAGSPDAFAAAVRAPLGRGRLRCRAAVRDLRQQGHTVVCVLPGHEHEGDEFECDRELVRGGSGWELRPLSAAPTLQTPS